MLDLPEAPHSRKEAVALVVVGRRTAQLQLWLDPGSDASALPLPWEDCKAGETPAQRACHLARALGVERAGDPVVARDCPPLLLFPARGEPERASFVWLPLKEARKHLEEHSVWSWVEAAARIPDLPANLLVDADGCPRSCLRITEAMGQRYQWPVVTVASFNHQIQRQWGGEHVRVGNESQAADVALANRLMGGDILVTPDYGLAALALGKGARALSPHGRVFTSGTMDFLLDERHLKATIRRRGGRTRGPAPRSARDDQRFQVALENLLSSSPCL